MVSCCGHMSHYVSVPCEEFCPTVLYCLIGNLMLLSTSSGEHQETNP